MGKNIKDFWFVFKPACMSMPDRTQYNRHLQKLPKKALKTLESEVSVKASLSPFKKCYATFSGIFMQTGHL